MVGEWDEKVKVVVVMFGVSVAERVDFGVLDWEREWMRAKRKNGRRQASTVDAAKSINAVWLERRDRAAGPRQTRPGTRIVDNTQTGQMEQMVKWRGASA